MLDPEDIRDGKDDKASGLNISDIVTDGDTIVLPDDAAAFSKSWYVSLII